MPPHLLALLARQEGVVARRQLLAAGLAPHDVRRLVRRRELHPRHPGVLAQHDGPAPWGAQAWAALLWAGDGACLQGPSALRADGLDAGGAGRRAPVHLAVDRDRHLAPPPEITVHRVVGLEDRARWHLSPPRDRLEDAVLDVAAAGSRLDAVGALTAAVGARRTTADRLRATLEGRGRIRQRRWLEAVLADVADGTCSVLEHLWVTRVERPHGLPRGVRQAAERSLGGMVYRDLRLGSLLVELDGRLVHDDPLQRTSDQLRDLDALLAGSSTARVGWGLVMDHACWTAAAAWRLLVRQGWTGPLRACPDCPSGAWPA